MPSAQPARIYPAPVSSPRAVAPRPVVTIGALLKGKSLLLAHRAGPAVRDLQLVAIGQGTRCEAKAGDLEPGEALMVMWDELVPVPSANWRPERVELQGATAAGRFETTVTVE